MEKENNLQSPFIRSKYTKQKIMLYVFLSLIPSSLFGIYIFGKNAALIIIISLITAIITDNLMQKITNEKIGKVNYSSLLTGLIFALIIPPTVPLWIPVIGVIISIILGKYIFGIASNIFNPALVGRVFLVISFPVFMTAFIAPINTLDSNNLSITNEIDTITSATPLSYTKQLSNEELMNKYSIKDLFFGFSEGCIGETSAFLLIIAGIILIFLKIIDWRIPIFYIGSFTFFLLIFNENILFHLFSGGLIFGAIFMATDYVTSPITKNGKIIFAISLGLLTFLFRIYSSIPEGVMYSILFMNLLVPLIEKYTMPKPFGYVKSKSKKNGNQK
ncbi:MAG: RnfABCDGE type electron transport complex subunit D [Nanoarchaeota archaeon]